MTSRTLLIALLAGASLAVPGAASAATLEVDGADLVFKAAPGEDNTVAVNSGSYDTTKLRFDAGYGNTLTAFPAGCDDHLADAGWVECPRPAGAVRYELGDGDDDYGTSSSWDLPDDLRIFVDGGPGDDTIEGWVQPESFTGGPGKDTLSGWKGDDALDGGDDDDVLDAGLGRDRLSAGAGNDVLTSDGYNDPSSDVVDGGDGVDTIEKDYSDPSSSAPPLPVNVTLAGGADDGRPGENDDIRGVERMVFSSAATVIGTDAAEYVKLHQVGGDGVLVGNGGDDELRGGDGADRIDGGAGADELDGGFGDDTITGGPGRDAISSDLAGGDCGPLWCKIPYGNDTVDARDGEADSIECGAGTDKVVADAVDTVAPTCETVDKPAADEARTAEQPAGGAGAGVTAAGTVRVASVPRLRAALRSGLRLTLAGVRKGTKVKAVAGRRTVGRGRVGKRGKVTIRFAKAARRSLARKRVVKLTIVAGGVRQTVTLRR